MPAFTFEKISPPATSGPIPPTQLMSVEQKPRGVIVQVLGRFVEARVQRVEQVPLRRDEPPGK
jgi:hypothetical protein